MTFEPKKFEEIYTNMVQKSQEKVPTLTDFQVGSVIRTMYESFAYEIGILYEQLNQVYLSAFIDSAEGPQLEMLVALLGIQRGLPDFAEGTVTFQRDLGTDIIEIPVGTLVTTEDSEKSPKKAYTTIESQIFPANSKTLDVKIQAVEPGEEQVTKEETINIMPLPVTGIKSVINKSPIQFTGKKTETDEELRKRAKIALISSGKASNIALENALLSQPSVKEVKLIERFNEPDKKYGLVDIFVDGVDFSNETKVQSLKNQIDKVRAAGVFVRLQSAIPVPIDAVFKIEINPGIKISEMERKTIEKSVEESIIAYISQIKMGQPLLFSQLTRQILSVTNVYNIERFEICTYVPIDNGSIPSTPTQCYADNDSRKQIDIGEAQKIYLRKIWVTSQVKTVPIVIQFKINQDIQSSQEPEIINKLLEYFNSLKSGDSVKKGDIENKIAEAQAQITVEDKDLKLQVQASDLSPLAVVTLEEIKLSFAEKAELDKENLFIYRNILKIVGAVQFTPPKTTNDEEKNKIKQKIIDSLNDYLATLKPEENVDIDGLEKAAKNVVNDMPVKLNINDLITLINDQEELRISQKQIEVKQWEKAQLGNFCVTSEIESIKVDITKLSLKLVIPNPPPSGFKQTDVIEPIQKAVTKAIQEFPKPEQGKNLSYASLQQAILTPISSPELQNLLRGVTYVIENFDLIATSKSDNRTQTRNINNNKEIHVRSVEIIKEINPPATVEVK
ncbi:MAG: baseplate J/gp47 family protein [Microcystis sp. LE17-20A]|uniref:baseplate J/gp47 family protein n=1 Tax=unclassified Microcystis TaxID=2643300 RepID=UPI0022BEF48C|nr:MULTISPECIES: baseplate J/gp47 family protein [unclassified Microcystis]MCZ8038504.1 baseplate J/gp47 family protein [Microcystis sp. LE17-20A]MCZ8210544.1 baseplate J/gp47 family protein [Microcystis sp. LE19-8.1F]